MFWLKKISNHPFLVLSFNLYEIELGNYQKLGSLYNFMAKYHFHSI